MRDTDCGLTSVIFVRSGAAIRSIQDLKGKRVAVGANDSPQATLIPLSFLADHGLDPGKDFEVLAFDVLVGKHGDHIGGERDAARALLRGEADAACCIDGNHLLFTQEGTLPAGATRVVAHTPTLRPLQLHGSRWRAGAAGASIPRTAARHVVCRSGSQAAARYGRTEAMAAGPHRRIRSVWMRR